MTKRGELSGKQKRFIEEYRKDRNGLQAAIRAGYTVKSAPSMVQFNLHSPRVRSEIERLDKEDADKQNITREGQMEWLKRVQNAGNVEDAKLRDSLEAAKELHKLAGFTESHASTTPLVLQIVIPGMVAPVAEQPILDAEIIQPPQLPKPEDTGAVEVTPEDETPKLDIPPVVGTPKDNTQQVVGK
jgi:phage terminase small subunit